jgi:hypothetical protein
MAQFIHKPVQPPVFSPFDAVLIEGVYYFAGPDGKKVEMPQAEFERDFEPVSLVQQG